MTLWKLTDEELAEIIEQRHVCLIVMSDDTLPPVFVGSASTAAHMMAANLKEVEDDEDGGIQSKKNE